MDRFAKKEKAQKALSVKAGESALGKWSRKMNARETAWNIERERMRIDLANLRALMYRMVETTGAFTCSIASLNGLPPKQRARLTFKSDGKRVTVSLPHAPDPDKLDTTDSAPDRPQLGSTEDPLLAG